MTASLPVFQPRECGPCAACCTILGVSELGKSAQTRCSHEVHVPIVRLAETFVAAGAFQGRCRIYDTRPNSCRSFSCLWLSLGVGDRPDRLGVMLDVLAIHDIDDGTEKAHVKATEVRRGGFESARPVLEPLARRREMVVELAGVEGEERFKLFRGDELLPLPFPLYEVRG